jgi:pyruvate-ferredoxin/flavodoxin oxidoreductase
MKVLDEAQLDEVAGVTSKPFRSHEHPGLRLTIAIAPDDCTGCGVCIDVCPARSKEVARHKALDAAPADEVRDAHRAEWTAFLALPETDRTLLAHDTPKGAAALQPLFEFSGACAGCGETPYLKLLSQLAGDRSLVANATGCSSIYGGNLPTTPWSAGADGRGPAWSNSLFEDNAEFGLGMRLAIDERAEVARTELAHLAAELGDDAVHAVLAATQATEPGIREQRQRVEDLRPRLEALARAGGPSAGRATRLLGVLDDLVRRTVWIVGGDGWAYDIGFGGLDHVLASGRDVNVVVLDTEVYSNTGGQASKATPRAAVAKFATAGKRTPKKDLGAIAMAYGDVYVAQVAIGANDHQCVKAFAEAEAWPGPSLILAYSTCIAHGIDMATSMTHQKDLVRSGYWPLYRFHPGLGEHEHPFHLDSHDPSVPVADVLRSEGRFAMLGRTHPAAATQLGQLHQADVDERWRLYRQLAGVERTVPHLPPSWDEPQAPTEAAGPPEEAGP